MAQDGQEDFIPSIQEIPSPPAMPRENFIPQREEPPAPPATTLNYYTPEEAFTRFSQYLPIEATPNDLLVPSDDPRVYTYQMANGNIYQVPAYQEVLAERRTIGEAFRHAVDQIPSRTEVEEGLLNLPSALYGSIENMVQGRGTYEDVIGTATGMVGANVVPRSRFVDEILEDQPQRVDELAVDEDFEPITDLDLDTELAEISWDPEPEPLPTNRPEVVGLNDLFEQQAREQGETTNIEPEGDWDLTDVPDPRPIADPGRMWQPPPVPLREGKKPNSGVVPLYPPRDYEMPEYTPENTIVFRSPVRDLVAGMQIPSQGIKGSQFIKMLNDNPSIRNSEVSSLELGISPEARYTREELQQLVDGRVFQVEATVMPHSLMQDEFYTYQRQPVRDVEADYAEIVITATPEGDGRNFRANSQHFDDNTLAHTRVSFRNPDSMEGSPYVLVEEMQSDLIQKGWAAPEKVKSFTEFALDSGRLNNSVFIDDFDYELDRLGLAQQVPPIRSVLDTVYKAYEEELLELQSQNQLGFVGVGEFQKSVTSFISTTYPDIPENMASSIARHVRRTVEDYSNSAGGVNTQIIAPPIRNTQESTRLLVESLISYADRMGADEIVFPSLERILVAREMLPGTKDYEKALTPGSGFHQTYVSSLKKVIQELQQEFGSENLPVYSREINYTNNGLTNSGLSFGEVVWDFDDLTHFRNLGTIDQFLSSKFIGGDGMPVYDADGNATTMRDHFTSRYGPDFLSASTSVELFDMRSVGEHPQGLPTEGVAINIGALRDQYNLQYPRFSDGGLVTQTRSAFGGMI
jgi:hypothetical protein